MKEKDSKFTQYLLDCGIRSGWHDKEIDEFNVMYEEIEAICKNLNMSVEGLLTEGK